MTEIFKIVFMTSLYASFVGLIIIFFKWILKDRISSEWHYIIWVVLILKLIVPFGPESAVSLFNAVPIVAQNTNLTQATEQFHKSTAVMQQENPHALTAWKVQDTSLSIITIVERYMPYFWLFGAILLSIWLLYINYSLNRKIKKRGIIASESINLIFEECKNRMGVKRNIQIIRQDVIDTPALFGVFKPKILLSPAILNLNDKDISYILLHELAHYKRKDLLANYLLLVLQIIHWFNPVIWYCFKRIRQDMEVAADQRVLAVLEGGEQKEYGKTLLVVLESFSLPSLAPRLIGMIDDRKNMERRIRMIRMAEFFKSKRRLFMVTGILFVVILCGVLLTNPLTKQVSFEIGNYTLKVPSDWKVKSVKLN
ncbi:M56 family metallopeptidase [Bacillota bacterium LX-D]|nr:M56 family metallopeptidase [Bacillota bacterium LX-D]